MDTAEQDRATGSPQRKRVTDLLARATVTELKTVWETLEPQPAVEALRGPETGLVMVRGRIGGGGAAFNLGEATVSRAAVRLSSGTVGHGHVLGTDRSRARLAAIFDALWQEAEHRPFIEAQLLQPVAARIEAAERSKAEETAATRVDFFTMVRGED